MVKLYDFANTINAFGAGQKVGSGIHQKRSLKDFAAAMESGDWAAASGQLAKMGDIDGAMNVRNIPVSDRSAQLKNDYTSARIDDIGIDNSRADRSFAATQGQRQFTNALAEAKYRMAQGKANSTLGKLKMDLDAGFLTPEQYQDAVTKATTLSKGVTVNTGPTYNNDQAKAAGFADRMKSSENVLKETQGQGTDKFQTALEYLPFGSDNLFQSEDRKQYEQAKRDFINAILRRESGAAIGKDEFSSADAQYFPQPGDTDAIIQQKAANRATALQGVERAAGQGYQIEQQQQQGGVPQPGFLKKGHVFLGGDPSDQNNWAKVR